MRARPSMAAGTFLAAIAANPLPAGAAHEVIAQEVSDDTPPITHAAPPEARPLLLPQLCLVIPGTPALPAQPGFALGYRAQSNVSGGALDLSHFAGFAVRPEALAGGVRIAVFDGRATATLTRASAFASTFSGGSADELAHLDFRDFADIEFLDLSAVQRIDIEPLAARGTRARGGLFDGDGDPNATAAPTPNIGTLAVMMIGSIIMFARRRRKGASANSTEGLRPMHDRNRSGAHARAARPLHSSDDAHLMRFPMFASSFER